MQRTSLLNKGEKKKLKDFSLSLIFLFTFLFSISLVSSVEVGASQKYTVGVLLTDPTGSLSSNGSYAIINGSHSIINAKIGCENITGADSDFCNDASGSGSANYTNLARTNQSTSWGGNNLTASFFFGTLNVTRGYGFLLTGSPLGNSQSLDIDPTVIQNRIPDGCDTDQAIRTVNQDGSVACINIAQTTQEILNQTNCPAGNYSYGYDYENERWLCRSDVSGTAGVESDPIFVAQNTTIWTAINNRLTLTDQRYNETLWVLAQAYLTSFTERDPSWTANFTNMQADCPTGNYSYGILGNGTLKCRTDISGSGETYTNGTGILLSSNQFNLSVLYTNTLYASIIWAHNQTTPAKIYSDANTIANMSLVNLQTIMNASGIYSTYNATYNGLINNVSYLSTFNLTYEGLINNISYLSTFNSTYALWSYNQTTPAINYCAANFNYTSFLNNLTSADCPTNYVVQGVQANGTVQCVADQTGEGGAGSLILYFSSADVSLTTDTQRMGQSFGCATSTPNMCELVVPVAIHVSAMRCHMEEMNAGDQFTMNFIDDDVTTAITCQSVDGGKTCSITGQDVAVAAASLVTVEMIEDTGTTTGPGLCSVVYTID